MHKISIKLFTILSIVFVLLLGGYLVSQEAQNNENSEQTGPGSETIPSGYRDYTFGISIDDVRQKLSNDPQFLYQGEPDVTLVEPPDRTTIGVAGSNMLTNGFFLFYQDTLYGVILEMNPQSLDYFALYSQLYKKYGNPTTLNPQRALWESEGVFMSLERSLFVKYIDQKVFDEIKEKVELQKSYEVKTREDFLNEL